MSNQVEEGAALNPNVDPIKPGCKPFRTSPPVSNLLQAHKVVHGELMSLKQQSTSADKTMAGEIRTSCALHIVHYRHHV